MKDITSIPRLSFCALLCIVMLSLNGCKILYTPNMENVPLLREEGEIRATLGRKDYQVAYAITDHIGVLTNGYYNRNKWELSSGTGSWKSQYDSRKFLFEAGGGYFHPLNDIFTVEAYGGGGYGMATYGFEEVDNNTVVNSKLYSANTVRFFVQSACGLTTEYIDVAFSVRFNTLKFVNIDTLGFSYSDMVYENINDLEKPLYMFLEPAITFRAGYKWAKFHMQFIYNSKINQESLNYSPIAFNIGLHVNIANRFK